MSQTINLNLIPDNSRHQIHISQYDIGRTFIIRLYEDSPLYSIPSGSTVKIEGTKPSGFGFSVNCSYSGSDITVVTEEIMSDEWGSIPVELSITKDGELLGTANFYLVVERSPHPHGTTDGMASEVIPILTLLVERVEAAVEKAEVLQESEAWAVGTRDGVPVDEEDPVYHNNSKWYAEQAELSKTAASNSEHTATEKASEASESASTAGAAKTDAEAAAAAAAASAEAAASVFSVVGNVAFSVLPNGQVRETWTKEEE